MTPTDLARILCRELEGVQREIALFPDDESVWTIVTGLPNPAGNLALHLAGNIQHYIGAGLGRSGYIRDREAEFSRRSGSRSEVIAEMSKAIAAVRVTVPALTAERLAAPTAHSDIPTALSTGRFLLHLAVHAGYHLGQIDYARRVITGNSKSAGVLALASLTEEPI